MTLHQPKESITYSRDHHYVDSDEQNRLTETTNSRTSDIKRPSLALDLTSVKLGERGQNKKKQVFVYEKENFANEDFQMVSSARS